MADDVNDIRNVPTTNDAPDIYDAFGGVHGTLSLDIDDYTCISEKVLRRIHLNGAVMPPDSTGAWFGASDARLTILQFNTYDKEDGISPENRQPIWLFIDSPGGSLSEAMALVDVIEASETPVYTVAVGMCASAAFLIFLAGHRRFAFKYTTFMMHDGRMAVDDNTQKFLDFAKFSMRVEEEVIRDFVLSHSKMDPDEYDNRKREDYYMLAEEAMKQGFVDQIVQKLNEVI